MAEEEEEEGEFEEWDADFLDQLIQVEELALSNSSSSLPNPNPSFVSSQPPTTPFSHLPPLPQQQHRHNHLHTADNSISYSPPRHLSQRPPDDASHSAKDQEIERLKRELGRASKHLTDLERECSELRKERHKIKSTHSRAQEKQADVYCPQNANLEDGVLRRDSHRISQHHKVASSSEAIGVQTDNAGDFSRTDSTKEFPSHVDLSEKLLEIWRPTSRHIAGRNLISKLFAACPEDCHALFGVMRMDIPSKIPSDSLPASLKYPMHCFPTAEAEKVSHLYFVLTKVNNGLLQLEALFDPLLDLCSLNNVAILRSSLRIFNVFLKHLLSFGRRSEGRNNVKVEGLPSQSNIEAVDLFTVGADEASNACSSSFGTRPSETKLLSRKGWLNVDIALLHSSVNWFSLFDLMHRISVSNPDACVKVEAVSIMNVILMRSNTFTEREMFGKAPIFESIAQFLRKDAGSCLQKEALCLLHSLLNCPKLLNIFCSGCKGEIADSENGEKNASTLAGFAGILVGLADCIACFGNSLQDIELRRRTVIMMAFLASSGKSGFEILVSHKLPGEANFLLLLLQALVSEMDAEASVPTELPTTIKARTLFMREALILLNRLVSNPAYSATILRLLTASRDMASLTVDIASRLSQGGRTLKPLDSITRKIRESEIIDLAQVFKKRVFAYLGDKIS